MWLTAAPAALMPSRRRYQNAYNAHAGTVPIDDDSTPPSLKEGSGPGAGQQPKSGKKTGFLARMFACGAGRSHSQE